MPLCANCHGRPPERRRRLCPACRQYQVRHGRPRPVELERRRNRRLQTGAAVQVAHGVTTSTLSATAGGGRWVSAVTVVDAANRADTARSGRVVVPYRPPNPWTALHAHYLDLDDPRMVAAFASCGPAARRDILAALAGRPDIRRLYLAAIPPRCPPSRVVPAA